MPKVYLASLFALTAACAANGMNAASVDSGRAEGGLKRRLPDVRTDETSAINKTAVLLGSPAFQQR
jgi:hypothetical protein